MAFKINLWDEIQRVCGFIPEGFKLSVVLELGAGWVELIDPNGIEVDIDFSDLDISEQMELALKVARGENVSSL